jgi:D-psicose/D-tagatose/L-ribulose 3-epimerase
VKLGFCGSIEQAALFREWGYDYVELALAPLAVLPDADFAAALTRLRQSGLPCLACNIFLPRSVRVTGNAVDPSANQRYLRIALGRAAELGAEIVVFGSSSSRNIPGGFPAAQALEQFQAFAGMAAGIAAENGIILTLEPLNATESNIINRVSEGLLIVSTVSHPHFKVMADYYHMLIEREDLTVLQMAGDNLQHVHTSNLLGHKIPLWDDQLQQGLLVRTLQAIGYRGNLSIEAGFRDDLAAEAQIARQMFRSLLAAHHGLTSA